MRCCRITCFAFVGALLCAPVTLASHITLAIDPVSHFRDGAVSVDIRIANRGDEPAMSVRVETSLQERSASGPQKDTLDIGETTSLSIDLGPAPRPSGIYTIPILVHYADANGHPFTALSSILLATSAPDNTAEQLAAELSPLPLHRTGAFRLSVSNTSKSSLSARASLVLPGEVECLAPTFDLTVEPGQTRSADFPVRNASALPGSNYPVFAVIDYVADNIHRSFTAPSILSIRSPAWRRRLAAWLPYGAVPLILLFLLLQFPRIPLGRLEKRMLPRRIQTLARFLRLRRMGTPAVFIILFAFTLWHLHPSLLFLDTMTVGGDTPAHNYMASHLRQQLFSHGRIVSWSQGWWCGFPMFQFYFPLPYLLVAVLDLILPFNVAFKLVSVSGLLALPAAAWLFARLLRFPRPAPILMAVAMIPFLFVHTHNMWGVNVYSTLAGMIANSISFALMLVFVGCAWRDASDGRFRLRTVMLLALLVSSHFFTSLMSGIVLLLTPLFLPRRRVWRAFGVLAVEGAIGLLLMAWWIVPLVVKGRYTVDFGHDWTVEFWKTFPTSAACLIPFALIGILSCWVRKIPGIRLLLWMGAAALGLFFGGSHLSNVFDNIRMWPFLYFAFVACAAVGFGCVLHARRANMLAVSALLLLALTAGIDRPNRVSAWAGWNYEGIQRKATWPVFERLVLPLDGTPGRLANDLQHDNNSLGSSRIFESVPYLICKPVLEGGIVNSAAGSMFSYYIQGETSQNSAGFPNIVKPARFNVERATRHLELFNVKHFIARWETTRQALSDSPDWRPIARAERWELFELTTHQGQYVVIPENYPAAVRLSDRPQGLAWKEAGLDWIYTFQALKQPYVLLDPDDRLLDPIEPVLTEPEYRLDLQYRADTNSANLPPRPVDLAGRGVEWEEITDNSIRFRTSAVGLPHLVKVTHYPNWKVTGAAQIYRVTPCFMLVYPREKEVELYYGFTLSDNVGRLLSLSGWIALAGVWIRRRRGIDHDNSSVQPAEAS